MFTEKSVCSLRGSGCLKSVKRRRITQKHLVSFIEHICYQRTYVKHSLTHSLLCYECALIYRFIFIMTPGLIALFLFVFFFLFLFNFSIDNQFNSLILLMFLTRDKKRAILYNHLILRIYICILIFRRHTDQKLTHYKWKAVAFCVNLMPSLLLLPLSSFLSYKEY